MAQEKLNHEIGKKKTMPTNLENLVNQEGTTTKISRKEKIVDTFSNITYSLVVGSVLDYSAGLRGLGIVTSRASATGINTATGALYGMWRNYLYRTTHTTEESSRIQKCLVDWLALTTFQLPVYCTAIAVGSLCSEGNVNWNKIQNGATYLLEISPLIGPTLGWYQDFCRRQWGLKSAAKKT